MTRPRRRVRVGVPLAVFVVVVTTVMLVVVLGGYDLSRALTALWSGSIGSSYAFFSETLVRATPLILLGLSVAIAFRAGIFNIGAEGQLLAGATAAVAVGLGFSQLPGALLVAAELIAAGIGGALFASIAAVLKRRFGVLEVISTLMLNFVARYAVSYLVRGPLQESTHAYPQSATLTPAARLPNIIPGQQTHLGLLIALTFAGALWWYLRSTAAGFRIRAVGAGPIAAASSGRIDVPRVVFGVFLVSGAIAGLAGGIEATGVTYALYEDISPGLGYSAIAVALLARLHPLAVVIAALFFGALEAGATAMQRDAGVPSVFVAVVEALVILGVLAVGRIGTQIAADRLAPEPVA